MKSKLISIPYTVGIIKPHIALQEDKVKEIYKALYKNNFEIFHERRKILTKEEVLNLFYGYRTHEVYNEIQEHMLTSESIVLLLINKVEKVWSEEKGEEVKLESPIIRWKKLIGNKDPEVAKTEEPLKLPKKRPDETQSLSEADPAEGSQEPSDESKYSQPRLRGIFGKDLIRNAFWGSDDAKAANKERDVFLFPIPERPPPFTYVRTKVSLDNILKFMFPPNLEHSNSTGRLDLFALYGPTVHYHSVDTCFCPGCMPIAKS